MKKFSIKFYRFSFFIKEKIDILRVLGAQVTTVPVVPITDPNNYNHHVFIERKLF